MKPCRRCNEVKAVTEFYGDKTRSDGLQYWCKDCVKARGQERWQEQVGSSTRAYRRMRRWLDKYGLTENQVNDLLDLPCFICGRQV